MVSTKSCWKIPVYLGTLSMCACVCVCLKAELEMSRRDQVLAVLAVSLSNLREVAISTKVWSLVGILRKRKNICFSLPSNNLPKKLLGCGVSTPVLVFCLMCTINSELTYIPICNYWVRRGGYPLVFSGRVRHPLDSRKLFVQWAVKYYFR